MEIQQKSTLAKLLATENITLEHRKVETAYFDLKERKVVLPMWKNMDADLYDMLIGHEVSHALNTPFEGWHDNVVEYGPAIKSFLNVVEDARIERLIKEKFPGLVKNFYAGYRKLFNEDFFGVKGRDLSSLPLIDRINLHFKIGSMLGITFTDEEQVYVDRVSTCETWDEVVDIAHDLFGKAKEEQEEQEQSAGDDEDFDAEDFEDFEENNESGSSAGESDDDSEEEETDEAGNASGEQDEETDEESEKSSDPVVQQGPTDSSEPVAETDMNFRQSEGSLLAENAKDIVYVDFNKVNPKHWVIPAAKTWEYDFSNIFQSDRWNNTYLPSGPIAEECLKKFKQKNTAAINQLVMQFEMKRKAKALTRARENKTGELNMKKLWATQLTEDVFLSNTVTPQGKNHGMMMFVDFSGSMVQDLAATLEQTLIMVAFCKKVNIPFDVYLFTNNSGPHDRDGNALEIANGGYKPGKMVIDDDRFNLVQLINSSMNSRVYSDAFKKCLLLAEVFNCYVNYRYNRYNDMRLATPWDLPSHLQTGGTPLVETAIVARELVKRFKSDNNIEVMNTIFLTDGDPTGQFRTPDSGYEYPNWNRADRIAIKEGSIVTVEKFNRGDRYISAIQYRAVLKHLKATVDTRLINFHIGQFKKYQLSAQYFEVHPLETYQKFEEKYKKEFLGNKFFELEKYSHFDTSYLIKNGKDLEVDDQVLEVKSEKKADILKGFRNFQKNKASSRVFLNRLMEKVA